MKLRLFAVLSLLLTLVSSALLTDSNAQAVSLADGYSRSISSGGTTSFQATAEGSDGIQNPEFAGDLDSGNTAADGSTSNVAAGVPVNRSLSKGQASNGVSANSGKKAKSNPELNTSFNGLNFRQQRLANNGNQFSLEPPDQGMCAGNGYVMESVNDVLRVYDTAGNPLIGVVDLNTFYGYAPAINRTTGVRGPFVTDPSCYYDNDTQRWFQVVLTLDTTTRGAFTGPNHLDVAVSNSSNPTGSWTIYRIAAQDDGTQGTPNHNCDGGPCLGDYPHIGADQNGFYITTNEYPFFGDGFHAAQIYALSKAALAANLPSVNVVQFDTIGKVAGNPGFTVWPAISPAHDYAQAQNGTEYFLSSTAAQEANGNGPYGTSTQIGLWALTNTASLNSATPSVNLVNTILGVNKYTMPPMATQKAGDFPLGQCLNTPFCATTFLLGHPDPYVETETKLDSNDTRMMQVYYAQGKLWSGLDTGVNVDGQTRAGIAWYIIKPSVSANGVKGDVANQGTFGLANTDLTYPTIAVLNNGRGVMSFTLTGDNDYPSQGYASMDALIGMGDVHIAAAGAGPEDGFTGYKGEVGNPPRPRWGDYGSAATDGQSIWFANEYIAQTCTLAQYTSAPFGSCGGTRATLGNWATRISKVTP